MSGVMASHIRHLQERLAASEKRVADLEAGLRPFAEAYRELRARDNTHIALSLGASEVVDDADFAHAAELVPADEAAPPATPSP